MIKIEKKKTANKIKGTGEEYMGKEGNLTTTYILIYVNKYVKIRKRARPG